MSAVAVKRGVFDVLRRGLDNTIVNWPLIVFRIVEVVAFVLLILLAVFAVAIRFLVSLGIEIARIRSLEDLAMAVLALRDQWPVVVWFAAAVIVLIVMFLMVHAFIEAGSARVYVDGERSAGASMDGPRSRFRVFSVDRWLAGAREGWWKVFWIYNLAWSAAGLILLIPLLPTMAGMLLLRERQGAAIATGCVGLVLTGFLFIFVGVVTGMWVNRAVAEWATRRTGARDALTFAWAALRADVGRHLLIWLATFVVALAASSFFSSLSFFAGLGGAVGNQGVFEVTMLPVRIFGALLNWGFSAVISAWYLASYASLSAEQ